MTEEIVTLVRLPLAEFAKEIRAKHRLAGDLIDSRIEGENLVLYFSRMSSENKPTAEGTPIRFSQTSTTASSNKLRKRRSHGKRNRMKTRGWTIVSKIVNSQGQTAAIYAPLVNALSKPSLSRSEQRRIVRDLLISNGNKPTDGSIEYFLQNTLEYLSKNR